jgi:hypothetical protein
VLLNAKWFRDEFMYAAANKRCYRLRVFYSVFGPPGVTGAQHATVAKGKQGCRIHKIVSQGRVTYA